MSVGRRTVRVGAALVAAAVLLAGAVAWFGVRDGDPSAADSAAGAAAASPAAPSSADQAGQVGQIARGAYLVRAGSCQGCHSERGGLAFAGGRGIETPFGIVYASNLTPDAATGLGAWSADDFWRALHHGRSRDGRLLYPAFPYPNYTRLARADADAMFAWLRTLPAVVRADTPHALRFPFDQPAALAVWRALFFRPARFEVDARHSPPWNRGAYLVETLGHCNACHSRRNALGATAGPLDLAGGLIPVQNWYAPSLHDPSEAGVAGWPAADVVALLRTGVAPHAVVQGPMVEVVANSTRHLSDADLTAMTTYLQSLPGPAARPADKPPAGTGESNEAGARLYELHCAGCHGRHGEGVANAYPALAGNRAVTLDTPVNLVHVILNGGFAPTTPGNPRPFGMPPFATVLSDADVAAILSFLRGAWSHRASRVAAYEVSRYRSAR